MGKYEILINSYKEAIHKGVLIDASEIIDELVQEKQDKCGLIFLTTSVCKTYICRDEVDPLSEKAKSFFLNRTIFFVKMCYKGFFKHFIELKNEPLEDFSFAINPNYLNYFSSEIIGQKRLTEVSEVTLSVRAVISDQGRCGYVISKHEDEMIQSLRYGYGLNFIKNPGNYLKARFQ